jgi:stage V sporulation protein G
MCRIVDRFRHTQREGESGMVITGVKIKLLPGGNENLLAIASILLDDAMVIKDIKVIRTNEKTFIAMPSRKATERCKKCRGKNNADSKFCNKCGARQTPVDMPSGKLHSDVVHPITIDFRKHLEDTILEAYAAELESSKLPGYRPALESGFDDAVVTNNNAGFRSVQ